MKLFEPSSSKNHVVCNGRESQSWTGELGVNADALLQRYGLPNSFGEYGPFFNVSTFTFGSGNLMWNSGLSEPNGEYGPNKYYAKSELNFMKPTPLNDFIVLDCVKNTFNFCVLLF